MLELLSLPAIIAAVEAFKMGGLPTKYAALLAVALGIIFGALMDSVVAGMVMGLAASGLYSGAKAIITQ